MKPVYLDYAATTPLAPEVREVMARFLETGVPHANPASAHAAGRMSLALVETARSKVADLINADPSRLILTSGATEANNLAILGAARYRQHRGRHLITMQTEHKAVVGPFQALAKSGFDVTWLLPGPDGRLEPAVLEAAIRDDTQLVSVMHINNETGAIQDIATLAGICRAHDVLFHTDAAQSAGKLPLDMAGTPVDLLALTAHKFYGPQGIGALYVAGRAGCHVEPLMHGGGQERHLRPGTMPVPLIAGMGAAAAVAAERISADLAHCQRLRERLWHALAGVDGLLGNSPPDGGYPGILNVSAPDVDGESLLLALEPIMVARGSACNAQSGEPSPVLRALGRTDAEAGSAVRFSFGRMTTVSEIDAAAERYCHALRHLRGIAPAA